MSSCHLARLIACLLLLFPAVAQSTENNSNLWPYFHDEKSGFRISYPPEWLVVKPKGKNVKFSVNPPDGAGNCNVTSRASQETANEDQNYLNAMLEVMPQDREGWAGYMGLPKTKVRIIQSRLGEIVIYPEINGAKALVGVVETELENLEGKYTRTQMVAMSFRPGRVWALNCGVSTFNVQESSARFNTLAPYFRKIFGSFAFVEYRPKKAN